MPKLGVIGECMLELRQSGESAYHLGYGGDAFNTAVYASRLGLATGFISALGDDYYSDWLLEQWQLEGVDCTDVRRLADNTPGLYIIRNDDSGERYFHYWRSASPFRKLLKGMSAEKLASILGRYDEIYFTGIGLALLADADRDLLLTALQNYRDEGGRVAFDPNYRPALWASAAVAARWIDRAYMQSDIVLPSIDDEVSLRNDRAADAQRRLQQLAVAEVEVVIKSGEAGCSVFTDGVLTEYPLTQPESPIDTTAAGDSFNAAYLYQRMSGAPVAAAVSAAQALAARVVMHRGAIIARESIS